IDPNRPAFPIVETMPQQWTKPEKAYYEPEPSDAELREWAKTGRCLSTLIWHSGEVAHNEAMLNLIDLAVINNVKMGIGVHAQRYETCPQMSQIFLIDNCKVPDLHYNQGEDPETDPLAKNRYRASVALARKRGEITLSPNDIPYRSLLPRGMEGLLTAGRCISGDHTALASYRIVSHCMAIGEAAGTAAALSVASSCTPRELAPEKLRLELANNGANPGR
ncbi:MAG: FAD-dependent oxidoreductase, partial [Lentisphaerota bacterium]